MKTQKLNESKGIDQNANLVLIGGGLYASTARPLLEFGLALSGKDKPNVLLIPTAKDKPKTFETFSRKAQQMYGEDIGTSVEMLHGYNDMPTLAELQAKVDDADVLYMSGGNSRYAVDQWKKHGIDSTETPDSRVRSEHFKEHLIKRSEESGLPEFGLGLDNNAGLLAVGGLVRIIASHPSATLHVVRADPNGEVTVTELAAPRLEILNSNPAAKNNMSDGISWEDFYAQLSVPTKNPRVTASAS